MSIRMRPASRRPLPFTFSLSRLRVSTTASISSSRGFLVRARIAHVRFHLEKAIDRDLQILLRNVGDHDAVQLGSGFGDLFEHRASIGLQVKPPDAPVGGVGTTIEHPAGLASDNLTSD